MVAVRLGQSTLLIAGAEGGIGNAEFFGASLLGAEAFGIGAAMELAFGSLSLTGLSVIAVTIGVAGLLRGFLGFGGSLLISMVANIVFGPKFAVALACLSGLPTTAQLLPDAIRHSDRRFTVPFGLASLVFIPLGTWVLVTTDAALMRVVVSACVLAMTLFLFLNWSPAYLANRTVSAAAGAFSGLIQGAAGVGGPPAVAMAMAHPGGPERQRGNVIGAVTFLGTAPLVPLTYLGLFTREVIAVSLAVIPIYLFTTWIGQRYFLRYGRDYYRKVALYALTLVSSVTLAIAVRDFAQA
jgi:uncharacterized membrane protein YfcA